jgi:uncharacterized membrane protein
MGMTVSTALHALAAAVWVGGMFFAHLVLRPSVADLAPADRLHLWGRVLGRFFPIVLGCIAVLLLTGYHMLSGLGGFAGSGVHVHVMQLTGWAMFLLFFHLYFVPWRRYRMALAAGENDQAGRQLATIRLIVTINLTLGLITIAIGASGRHWG